MAEAQTKTPKVAKPPADPPAAAPETEQVGEFTLTHKGHGKYGVDNKEFKSRDEALGYIRDLETARSFQERFGDVVPEGVSIRSQHLEYRGTLLELPMNEVYLPDGGHNPYYDRAWYWGWGRAEGPDVANKQARGYRVVTREEVETAVEEGTIPAHYLSLLMSVDHGNRMQYGDLVLLRVPRVLWRQQRAAKEQAAMARIKRQDEQNQEVLDRAGVKNVSGPITNEVSTGLKISGF